MKTTAIRRVVTSVVLVVAAVVLAGSVALAAGNDQSETVKIRGEIVDLACYLGHGARGAKHQQCALTCLKNGQPMGLLTDTGEVYLLLGDHQDAKPFEQAKTYAADEVEITGPLAEKAGIKAVTVESVAKL